MDLFCGMFANGYV